MKALLYEWNVRQYDERSGRRKTFLLHFVWKLKLFKLNNLVIITKFLHWSWCSEGVHDLTVYFFLKSKRLFFVYCRNRKCVIFSPFENEYKKLILMTFASMYSYTFGNVNKNSAKHNLIALRTVVAER